MDVTNEGLQTAGPYSEAAMKAAAERGAARSGQGLMGAALGFSMTASGQLEALVERVEALENENKALRAGAVARAREVRDLNLALGLAGEQRLAAEKRYADLKEKFGTEVNRAIARSFRQTADELDPPNPAEDEVESCPCGSADCDWNTGRVSVEALRKAGL